MSTIAPTASRAIGERLAERGVDFLEAPVSGSRPKAEDGTLTIMVGGESGGLRARAAAVRGDGRARSCTSGPPGTARWPSCSPTRWAPCNAAALAEAVIAGARRRASTPTPCSRWPRAAPATRPMLGLKGPPMLEHDFEPRSSSSSTCSRTCATASPRREALGVELRLGALAEALYAQRRRARATASEDFAAVRRAARRPVGK